MRINIRYSKVTVMAGHLKFGRRSRTGHIKYLPRTNRTELRIWHTYYIYRAHIEDLTAKVSIAQR